MESLRLINANMKTVKPTYVEASSDVGVTAIMETFNLDILACSTHSVTSCCNRPWSTSVKCGPIMSHYRRDFKTRGRLSISLSALHRRYYVQNICSIANR